MNKEIKSKLRIALQKLDTHRFKLFFTILACYWNEYNLYYSLFTKQQPQQLRKKVAGAILYLESKVYVYLTPRRNSYLTIVLYSFKFRDMNSKVKVLTGLIVLSQLISLQHINAKPTRTIQEHIINSSRIFPDNLITTFG